MTTPPDSAPAPAVLAPKTHRRGFGAWRWLVGSSVVVALPAALLAGLLWSLATPRGGAWLLAQQHTVDVEQMQGSLLNGFSAQRIVVHLPSGPNDRVVIDAPRVSALSLAPGGNARAWLRIRADAVSAERVSVEVAPSATPPSLPADLVLPVEVEVGEARLGRLELPGLETRPFRALRGRIHLGAAQGSEHRADALEFSFGPMQLRGQARLGSGAGLPLQARLDATQAQDAPAAASAAGPTTQTAAGTPGTPAWARALREEWRATAQADGPLARFNATLTLRAHGQHVDASAEVAPLEAWPLPRLDARTERLDLSALLSAAPATALSGTVRITPVAPKPGAQTLAKASPATLAATAQMSNERPGRWNEHRLPVRRFTLDLRAQPGALTRVDVVSAQAQLASDVADAGQVQGHGFWNAGAFKLDARLDKLQPGLLDPRLPAMTVSGPIKLEGSLDMPAGALLPALDLQAELDGQLSADAARAVRVRVAARSSANRVDVRELLAQAGAARLSLEGNAARGGAAAPWRLNGKASLADFDPLPWFPGEPQSAWRRGPHRVNAEVQFGADWPALEPRPRSLVEWMEWLPALNGELRFALRDSLLAGVPLRGDAEWQGTPSTPARLAARVDVAGSSARLQGGWARADEGRGDTWDVDIKAPQLARLAPLFALGGVPAAWATPAGALDAQATLQGRWPALRAQGQVRAQGLRVAEASVARGDARWVIGGRSADAPFELHAELGDARWAQQQARSVLLDLKGTSASHALDLNAVLNAAPPAWAESLLAARPADATDKPQTTIALQARGGVDAAGTAASSSPLQWRGSVQNFEVINGAGRAMPLAQWRDVALTFQPGDALHPMALTVQPGRGSVLGAGVRWQQLHWQAAGAGAPAQLDVEAELEPLAVAPLLARAQPLFGWQGDLRVGGRISVHGAPQVQADIVLERLGGDLSVTDETGTQALQLSDLRLALNANDGQWSFTQVFAGKTLGEAAGAVTARIDPRQWPNADTPIQGVLEARVANLGTWGAWVPPGWRLAGTMRTSASIGGHLGAPEYTGEVRGSGVGVRNIVQGVNVTDGEIAISLRGTNASIERFDAKAGEGSVRIEGGASLGEAPRAQLKLVAQKFQLLGRVDRRIVTSGSAQLQLDAASLKLDGKFSVDEGLIDFTRGDAPTLSDDVRVSARPGAPEKPAEAPAPRGSTRNINLDLQVDLGQNLRLRGRGLDTQLRGGLHLTTPANKLALNGTVRTATGTYAAYGQKLSIERGELTFTGAAENPRLDIIATRPNLEQTVGVAVTGTALNPRVRLFSEPEMADIDKLSWLVLGRASDGLGRTDTALLQRAAIGLLAGEGTGPTDQLINAIGLDEVSFRQTEGEVRETVVSLGKQLSRRWYVGYERSLNATTGNWQLIYRIAQRLTLRAQSGLDNSLDAIWTWRWQ